MRLLFLFLDGVGLGGNDPAANPLARAEMPYLQNLLGGRKLLRESAPYHGERAELLSLDAGLGVGGLPQSATGQASLLTGKNAPGEIGYHYGPKPDPLVTEFLSNGTIFSLLKKKEKKVALLNAYPPGYFEGIESGHRLYSAVPLAVTKAGIRLKDQEDLFAGRALSADFTGRGWREHLKIPGSPVYDPYLAGVKLAELAMDLDFAFFEYWLSDYAGHKRDMQAALEILSTIDGVIGGLASVWRYEEGLVLLTSDHGNMEDISTRRHTSNPVPAVILGNADLRKSFTTELRDIRDAGKKILQLFDALP
ncbi:MAG: metalloenzyme [Chloroflexi bacterium]|nr:MAG: metalloenzyme [Chloroflexota bacterium]